MRSVTLAFGSFVAGAISMFLMLSGSHTSTFVQPVLAQGSFITMPGLIPVVPPFTPVVLQRNNVSGYVVQLDGLNVDDCTFDNVRFEYGGGAFRLNNIHISGNTLLTLKGAAMNTFLLTQWFTSLNRPAPHPIPPKNKELMATLKTTETVTFIADNGVK